MRCNYKQKSPCELEPQIPKVGRNNLWEAIVLENCDLPVIAKKGSRSALSKMVRHKTRVLS